MRIVIFAVLAGALLSVQGCGQGANTPQDRCFSKGGLGIISRQLYIVLKSAKNELSLPGGNRWTGKGAGTREVVFFFEDRIWSPPDLPNGFDLSKAVVVSFEGDIIRFFEFDRKSGGYYERLPAE